MNERRLTLAAAAFLCIACVWLPGQAQQASGGSDVDSLFTDKGAPPPPADANAQPPDASPPALRADDPTLDSKIHYFGTLNIYGLLGLGWTGIPDPGNLGGGLDTEASGFLTATIGFEVRPTPQLRLRGTMSYNFPKTGTQLSELIIDYSVLNAVFFRFGIFDYTWGSSQFFQFSNLPYRGLLDWGIGNEPIWQKTNIISQTVNLSLPVSVKMYVPFGVNGLTLLARFDMDNYGFADRTTPDPRHAGYGFQYDLVTGPVEWTVGGFWQQLLTPRASLAMKTNILGFDFSVETTMAFPVYLTLGNSTAITTTGGGIFVGGVPQRIYPTAVIGLAREWSEAHIKMYAEYAFNGERDPGISWLTDESGPGGHNSAVVVRFANLGSTGITLNMLWQQNWSDGSGLLSPLFEISPVPLTTIQVGPVVVYGPDASEVMINRIVPGSKRVEILLLVKISESYRQ